MRHYLFGSIGGRLALAFDHSRHSNQDARPDESRYKITEPARQRYAQDPQKDVGNNGAHYAQNDAHEQAHIAFHEHLGEPSGDTSDDDRCDPTDARIIHYFPLS